MILFSLECILKMEGFAVMTALNGKAALEIILEHEEKFHPICCVIADIKMPIMDGFESVNEVQKRKPTIPVVVLSGTYSEELENQLNRMGVKRIQAKPISVQDVICEIHEIVSNHHSIK